jgi:serpin B
MVFSPASIVTALGMARAGARGETAAQMDKVLRVQGWTPLASGLNSLDQLLRSRDATWKDEYEEGGPHALALRTANMAFAQRGYHLEADYLDEIGRTFGSGIGLVDYIGQTEAARQAINGWVSRQTMGRIPELLGPNALTTANRLVLVNAVYLKAEWARPFMEGATTDRAFTTAAGKAVKVPTMELYGEQDIVLAAGDGWKATELAYAGPGGTAPLAMTVIVPDSLATFERTFSTKALATIQSRIAAEQKRIADATYVANSEDCGTYPYNVHLFMPKFGIDTAATLNNELIALGMPDAFASQRADFSGMTTEDRLSIGFVIHQANIDVDETGTEAAAATAVGMDTGGCTGPQPAKTKTLRLDRPFIYLLRDVQTGAILFMGRVTNPSQR